MRERYVGHLNTLLPPGLRTLLVTLEYDQTVLPGPPFAVDEAEVRRLYAATHEIEVLTVRDALAEESRWRDRGLKAGYKSFAKRRRRPFPGQARETAG